MLNFLHNMNLRRLITTSAFTLLASFMLIAPSSSAFELDLGFGGGDSVAPTECASLNSGLAGSLGCDGSDRVVDFTQYQGGLDPVDPGGLDEDLTRTGNIRDFIEQVVNFAIGFLGLIAVVIVIYGGALYLLSRGDEEMASKGKKTISYAAMGILIIAASFAIVNTILTATGGGSDRQRGQTVAGGAIIDSGESFDVAAVEAELTDITTEYIKTYNDLYYVVNEVEHMANLEMPLIFNTTTTDATLGGAIDFLGELMTGQDGSYADQSTFVDKIGVENYISELRTSIQRIQARVDSLSETYEASNDLFQYLRSGTKGFGIQSSNPFAPRANAYVAPGREEGRDTRALEDLGNDLLNDLDNEKAPGCAARDYDTRQVGVGLGATLYDTNVSNIDDNICPLIQDITLAVMNDYNAKISELVSRFVTLQALFDTSSVSSGGSNLTTINAAFETTKARLDKLVNIVDKPEDDIAEGENPTSNVSATATRDLVLSMDSILVLLQNLQFVSVSMTASAVQGSAPLIVRFDLLGTEDPSGITVTQDQISWDLNGDGNFGDAAGQPNKNAVSWQYDQPGTYRARVRVLSSSPDVAAGVATLSIRVGVRKSQIKLEAVTSGQRVTIADYSQFPVIDQAAFKVTEAEATEGILFDASNTADGNGQTGGIIFGTWDFGDDEVIAGPWAQQQIQSPTHLYGEPGAYQVVLEVTDTSQNTDRKIFTLYVGSPAARMSASPRKGIVSTQFKFDARNSSTDIGTIVSYKWSATKDGQAVPLKVSTGNTLTTSFAEPGIYTVTLTVVDSSGAEDQVSTDILVESQEPIALYEYKVPQSNKPAIYSFDATDSYDPDQSDVLTFDWQIEGGEYQILSSENGNQEILVEFLEIADYDVKLTVADQHPTDLQKSDSTEKEISIDNLLDVMLEIDGESGYHLDGQGVAEVEFVATSNNATAFEIDYGDGEVDFIEPITNGRAVFTHEYETAGVFFAKLTALDDDNKKNTTDKRVYIAAGDSPIAVIEVTADEDIGSGQTLNGSVNTRFRFNASRSINVDGTSRDLRYSWNFGDGVVSTQKEVTHSYDERANYNVSLTVKDANDPTVTNTANIQINIKGIQPKITRIVPVPQSSELVTPLKVKVSLDAQDEDGQLTFIKGWYYDVESTAEELGTVISQSLDFTLTINTNGIEGEVKEYGFAAEVTDNDNQTVSTFDVLDEDQIPTLLVTNGPNDTPVASFSVDRTSILVGEGVSFASTSFDPDGEITSYTWDVEGDGFFNNEPQTEASLTHTFEQIALDGIDVKLRVEDDAGATAISDPVTIYVDSIADAPEAAFLAEVEGTEATFTDQSVYDEVNGAEFKSAFWDFDGNGTIDGEGAIVTHEFASQGTYNVILAVTDTLGQVSTTEREILVIDADDPEAGFVYEVNNLTVSFEDDSITDEAADVGVQRYTWDFDADGEVDSVQANPTYEFEEYGSYLVTLTITDDLGKKDTYSTTIFVLDPTSGLRAILTSIPAPNAQNQIVLSGQSAEVDLFFSAQGNSNNYEYQIDKNIFFDSDGDGIRENDIDFAALSSGSIKTTYFKSDGQAVTKLTVIDLSTGERDVATLQVAFEGFLGSANLFNATPRELLFVILTTLVAVAAGLGLTYSHKPNRA